MPPTGHPESPRQLQLTVRVVEDGSNETIPVALVLGPEESNGVREVRPAIPFQDGDTLRVELNLLSDGYLTVLLIDSGGALRVLNPYIGRLAVAAGKRTLTQVTLGVADQTDDLLVIWTAAPLKRSLDEWQARLSAPNEPLDGEALVLRLSAAAAPLLRVRTRSKKFPASKVTTISHGYTGEPGTVPDTVLPAALKKRRPPRRSAPVADAVDCTVFAPPRVRPGDALLVQIFAHTIPEADAAAALAREFDETAERRGFTSLELDVPHGARLTFHFALTGLVIDEPVQSLVWKGRTASVQFAVAVPPGFALSKQIGTVTISQDGTPLGHVKFTLTIEAAGPVEPEPLGEHAHRYRRVFISYASRDRTEVLKRVQMLDRFRVSYFQDLLSLEPGARWEKELYKHIDDCDLFLLFWSSAARDSEWVMKEVRYAIARKDGQDANPPEIMPVILEGPPPVVPPKDLQAFHFNDKLRYFMDVPTS